VGRRKKYEKDNNNAASVLRNVLCAKHHPDTRDSKTYKTVTIGKQTWMAQNLNYYTEGSKCYNNNPENCEKYGRHYNWTAAIKACPSGWHLPSNAEWDALYRIADGTSDEQSPYKSETAGKYLKAKGGWNDFKEASGNGDDSFSFTALPGGSNYSGSSFNHLGNNGYWWCLRKRFWRCLLSLYALRERCCWLEQQQQSTIAQCPLHKVR